ncbi:IQ calmodulin-binding motif protein (macronuclear) [Tetrahymena thermophila SB210]|uniref:IQ calmodulin-binding motif protein n=1 Tax=Tetrahymena thermophila (strain SB210) TaxID=312017 RepID=I7M9U1_TETTS|nr:IQ calmodulin-binding motif protein [Tetrahymena thermophila SB210]EAS02809.1 IQ calmodulin-binding motif protein [Tetrahymena thermophila SB210]|eukprot:XP_001023054.1 IQ calmodulin-binding motif protein [Tetrahymena thermophila SB210]
MKSAKPAIIIPPVSQRKTNKSGKRVQSSDNKKKFTASGSQFANNNSFLSQNSNSSKNGQKDKLNTSLQEKKKRLEKLQTLLKGEKVNLKQEYDSEEEEDFEFIMKETALKEFQKQVNKQALLEDGTQVDQLQNSTTIKKEQLPAYLLLANQSLQETINLKQDHLNKENIQSSNDDKHSGYVAKNPRPQRESSNALVNNFIQEEDEEKPTEQKQTAAPSAVQPKRDFSKKRIYTAQQRIFMCVLIQATFRMYIQRKKYLKEKQRLEQLLQEHKKELIRKREENEKEQVEIEQGKTPLQGRHIIQFQGIDKLLQNSQVIKNQTFQRANKKRTHSEGPFSMYEHMKQNEEEGIIDQENEENRRYKLYHSKFNPLRKSRPPLPAKVPLNNNFFSDKGIVDCFVKKNRANLPNSLKKSSSSGESFNLSTLPEYNELLQKSKQAIRQPLIQQKQPKQEEDSVIYSDTFEKESIDASPVQKKFQFNKSTPQKRNSIHSVSEEDYLRESFDIDTPKESIKESIRESFNKESSRFQSSFSMSAKIKEDIPEESMIGESINESSIVDETEQPKNKKKNTSIQEDIIQTSIEDDYQNEKFESISEDLNNSEQKSMMKESIGEDIAGMSFESRGKRGKKKSVTFSKEKSEQIQKQLVGQSQTAAAAVSQFSKDNIQNNNSGILRRSTDSLSADQMVQISQKSNYSSQKLKESSNQATMQQIHEMYFGKDGVSDTWKKFEKIRNNYDDESHLKELNKEQMELGKLQKDIYSMLQNTKSLADKWQEERDSLLHSDKNASQKAEMVYQRYQSEFNRILQSAPMLNRFSLLKNYLEYRDRQMKNINLFKDNNIQRLPTQADTAAMIQKEVQSQIEGMVKNLEQKQEIMYKVLVQVVENLQNLRNPGFEFEDMKRIQGMIDGKIDQVFANQEKILKFQFEQEMVFRQDQLKLLYSGKPITEEELKLIRIRQLLAQNRQEQIIPFLQLDKANIVPNIVVQSGQQQNVQADDKNRLKDVSLSSSIDMEAMSDSKISWQSGQEIWDNLNELEKEKLNDFNTEQVVNFLSEMLMQEIQDDLFPMRMTTSHLQLKKNEKQIQERAMEKISPPKQHSHQQADKKSKIQSSIQSTMSPVINKSNSQQKLKSDRTLTEESQQYELDFDEDSEDKFGQSLQSNRSNNKSFFEDSDVSATKNKLQKKDSQERLNNKNAKEDTEDKVSEHQDEEEQEYENDFEDSVEKSTGQVSKSAQLSSLQQQKNSSQKQDNDFDDPMGIANKAMDRNAILAEISENEKKNPPNAPLPKLQGQAKKGKSKQLDDEDYKGDNDFFKPSSEDLDGNVQKNPNKDLYKNEQTYEKTSRVLNNLKTILKKKKKLKIIKDVLEAIAQNNVKGKKLDQFIGNVLMEKAQFQLFESHDCKKEDEKVIGLALQEHFYNNLIKNIQDLEQFHFKQAFNRKEIQPEIVVRWDHICEVAAQQTLQILEKVVPVDYYSDVQIDKYTNFKRVKRFCTINKVAKEDNELFELQNYELYKEEVNYQNELSDQVLQKIVNQLAKDLISIQNKQKQKI